MRLQIKPKPGPDACDRELGKSQQLKLSYMICVHLAVEGHIVVQVVQHSLGTMTTTLPQGAALPILVSVPPQIHVVLLSASSGRSEESADLPYRVP
jgi:hypothetical protein